MLFPQVWGHTSSSSEWSALLRLTLGLFVIRKQSADDLRLHYMEDCGFNVSPPCSTSYRLRNTPESIPAPLHSRHKLSAIVIARQVLHYCPPC